MKKKILPSEKKKKKEIKSYQDAEICYVCGKGILKKFPNDKNYQKFRTIVISQVNIQAQRIVFVI